MKPAKAEVHSPISAAIWLYEQVKAIRIGQFTLLCSALSRFDRYCCQSHDGIAFSTAARYHQRYHQIDWQYPHLTKFRWTL